MPGTSREGPPAGDPAAQEEPRLRRTTSRTPLLVLAFVAVVALGWLAADAFQESVVYYQTPTEAQDATPGEEFRLAGLVVEDSLAVDSHGVLRFAVTDGSATIPVRFDGRAPDSLTDGSEAVAQGRLGADGVFEADTVLARCASRFEAELEP